MGTHEHRCDDDDADRRRHGALDALSRLRIPLVEGASLIDQDVNLAVPVHQFVGDVADRAEIADVRNHESISPAPALRRSRSHTTAACDDLDSRSASDESACDSQTEPGGRARDHHDPTR